MTGSHDDLDSLADELGSMAELLRGVAAAPLRDPDLAARFAALAALPVQLGDYRLDAEVGGGGMGRVFRGRDLRLGRDVAIKVLRVGQHGDVAALGDALAREARGTAALDHPRIVAIYDALAEMTRSPVVELNRAVAVAMAFGPAAGLELVDQLVDLPALRRYHLLPSVRGELLVRLGRLDEARVELERAAAMTQNRRERDVLLAKAAACRGGVPS